MILGLTVDNFLVFSNEVELSLTADMRIKKFLSNVNTDGEFNALKSVCIFGANNVGKTCLTAALGSIKNVLLNVQANVTTNMFTESNVCSFGISFLYEGAAYKYEFKFDSTEQGNAPRGFIYERFCRLDCDEHKNVAETELFVRDEERGIYALRGDAGMEATLPLLSAANILIYTANADRSQALCEYKNILCGFARSIEIIDMNNIPINKTLDILKRDDIVRRKTVDLIKLADLDIDDFYLKRDEQIPDFKVDASHKSAVGFNSIASDMLKLTSVHRGMEFRSYELDSMGTKKVIAAAGYIVSALLDGSTIVIDEMDSSLHFKITRALVALFNNEKNVSGQLIFTAHDATLLDCRRLFRKDQLWFVAKDRSGIYLYSLAEFTAQNSGIRSESDILEKYRSGVLGAVPEPDLISVLLDEE